MTALEGDSVDLPDVALVAERIDVCVLDRAMLTGAVDGLRLRLLRRDPTLSAHSGRRGNLSRSIV